MNLTDLQAEYISQASTGRLLELLALYKTSPVHCDGAFARAIEHELARRGSEEK